MSFVLLYSAIAGLNSGRLIPVFDPSFLWRMASVIFAALEIILAVLLFAGKKTSRAAIVSVIVFALIFVFSFWFAEGFAYREIGLIFAALALFELTGEKNDAD